MGHGIASGLRQLGIQAEGVFESPHPFTYETTQHTNIVAKWWCLTGGVARKLLARRSLLCGPIALIHFALAWPVLLLSLVRYDAFIFIYGKTITNTRLELYLMRILKKKTIVLFVGSDSRPPYVNGAWIRADAKTMKRLTTKIRRRIHRFENAGINCINAPGTAHFHRHKVINWFAVGFPSTIIARQSGSNIIKSESANFELFRKGSEKIRLLHSPSNPKVKGTAIIERAIESMMQRGLPIEWIKITDLSNSQVLDEIQRCDLVVDQLYSDTPMAGLATEAAQFGKPTIVSGYMARSPQLIAGNWPTPPSHFIPPEQFENELEKLINSEEARRTLGKAASNFVSSAWSCNAVAGRLLACLRGEIPDDWWYDPSTTSYLQGCGLDEREGRRRVRELVAIYGESALGLDDKPILSKAFVDWALKNDHPPEDA